MTDKPTVSVENTAESIQITPKAPPRAALAEPRLRSSEGIRSLRAEWLVALLPVCLWSYFLFGSAALAAELTAMVCCTVGDLTVRFIRRKKGEAITVLDLTPTVIGLFIAFLLPYDCPLWLVALTALLAAGVGALFGSVSRSPLCLPALTVIAARMIFPALTDIPFVLDSESGVAIADLLAAGEQPKAEIADFLLGRTDGMIGEVASLLLLLAAAYLIFRGQISWQLPIAWLVGGALVAYLTAPETMSVYYYTGAQLLTGSFILVGCLILPFRTTAPMTAQAGLLVGFAGGALTILFRNALGVDGSLLAALLVSLPARPLDRLLAPAPFGGRRK